MEVVDLEATGKRLPGHKGIIETARNIIRLATVSVQETNAMKTLEHLHRSYLDLVLDI